MAYSDRVWTGLGPILCRTLHNVTWTTPGSLIEITVSSPISSPGKVQNGLVSHSVSSRSYLSSRKSCSVKVRHNIQWPILSQSPVPFKLCVNRSPYLTIFGCSKKWHFIIWTIFPFLKLLVFSCLMAYSDRTYVEWDRDPGKNGLLSYSDGLFRRMDYCILSEPSHCNLCGTGTCTCTLALYQSRSRSHISSVWIRHKSQMWLDPDWVPLVINLATTSRFLCIIIIDIVRIIVRKFGYKKHSLTRSNLQGTVFFHHFTHCKRYAN